MTRRILKAIKITEIASVDRPAHGEGARQVLMKRDDSGADLAKYNENHGDHGLFSSGDGGGGAGTRHTKDGGPRRAPTDEPAHVNTATHVSNAAAATANSPADAAAHKSIGHAKEAHDRGDSAAAESHLEKARFALAPGHPAHAAIGSAVDGIHRARDAKSRDAAAVRGSGNHPFESNMSAEAKARLYGKSAAGIANTNTNQGDVPADASGESETTAGKSAAESIGEGNTMSDTEKVAAAEAEKLKAAETKSAELAKKLAKAERLAELSDAEKAFAKALSDEDRETFIGAKPEERTGRLAKAQEANPVVFTAADGTEFRKNDDPRFVKQAQRNDELAKALTDERMEKRDMMLKAQAESDLRYLPGEVGVKVDLLKAIGTLPEASRNACLNTLKAQNERMSKAFESRGTKSQPAGGLSDIEAKAEALRAKEGGTFEKALLKVMSTAEGQELAMNGGRN